MVRVTALRRARSEVSITSAAVIAVTLALVLLAAGPIFADAVSTGALRRGLTDAPISEQAVVVEGRLWPDTVDDAEIVVLDEVGSAVRDIDARIFRSMETSTAYSAPQQPSDERTDIFRLGWVEDARAHVTLIAGAWPRPAPEQSAIEVAVDASAADLLGLELGETIPITARARDSAEIDVEVVALYSIDDPFAPFWHGRDRLAEPVTVTPGFRTVNLVVGDPTVIDAVATRPDVGWLVLPDFAGLELDEVDALGSRLVGLEAEVNARLFDPDADLTSTVTVSSELPLLLAADDRSVTVARAVIFATVAQLSALAAFALTLVAGLGVDARRSESAMLRARGAGPAQLTRRAVADAVLVVLPVALIAPFVATFAVDWFDDFGPLASIGLELEPRPVAAAWWTTGSAAVVTIALLVAPAARAAAAAASEGDASRPRLISPIQRSGIDLAIVAVAAFAYWQLRVLSDDRTVDLRDRFGVDPLVMLAPTFGIVAGALLVLRIVPLIGRLGERTIARRGGIVAALTVWQLARRPHRYTRTALLVTMGVAVGTFASVYEVTWSASQRAQAAHEVGADAQVEPNRRVGDSVGSVQLAALLRSIDGVETAMAVADLATTLPGDPRPGRLLALEAGAREGFNDEADPATRAALAELRDRRPDIPGIDLPGEPHHLLIPNTILEVDELGQQVAVDPDAPPALAGSLELTLQDADGLLHVVSAGPLAVETPVRSVELAAPEVADAAVPRAPLRIVDIQLDTVTQGSVSRRVDVTLGPIEVVDRDGTRSTVSLADNPLMTSTEALGFLAAPTSSTVSSSRDGSATIGVTTGASLLAVRIVHTVTRTQLPDAEAVAGFAHGGWAEAANVAIGDVVTIPTDRADGLRVEILGVVETVPTIDPNTTPAVLVDLPSMLWAERVPGTSTRNLSTYWLGAERGATLDADAFTRWPVEAVDVIVLEDRRAELTANPSALGSLGALGAGFIAAFVLALAALVLTAIVSVRERSAEFAVLDALGLRRRTRRAWLLREQAIIVVFGALLGSVIGLGLAYLVLPVTSLTQDGGSTFPPVVVIVPWGRLVVLVFAVVGTSLASIGIALGLRARASTGSTLRTGVDQ
ncbi:MAG: FtsX-like permease family protein [Actinomycetota bacterium]